MNAIMRNFQNERIVIGATAIGEALVAIEIHVGLGYTTADLRARRR